MNAHFKWNFLSTTIPKLNGRGGTFDLMRQNKKIDRLANYFKYRYISNIQICTKHSKMPSCFISCSQYRSISNLYRSERSTECKNVANN